MKKISLIAILLAMYAGQLDVYAAETCLASKEKAHLQTMRKSVKMLTSQINGIESSLKDTIVVKPTCPKDWKRYRGNCYLFSSQKGTWFQGQKYCHRRGGYLADIKDEKENKWILKHTLAGKNVWLGGSDLKEGQWLWTDFSPISYLPWLSGEPNGRHNENCLFTNPSHKGKFIDAGCNVVMQFLCKKKMRCECKV